jgi:hypothetical protein
MMDENERPETNEAEIDEQEKQEVEEAERLYAEAEKQHTEAEERYSEAEKQHTNAVGAAKQSGVKRREEAEQQRRADEEAEHLTDATRQSLFQTLADRTVSLQESNLRLTQNFFQNWIEQVHNQAQITREAAQNLRDQGQRQREAVETFLQESTNTYSEYLNSALSFYQEALSTATQVTKGNMQQAAQATQQGMQAGVQAASQAGQQAMEAANQAGNQGAQATSQSAQQGVRGAGQSAQEGALAAQSVATRVPIEDYDNLNVSKVVEQLDNLSADELLAVRAYEQQNKNRDTLLKQIDRRIEAAS